MVAEPDPFAVCPLVAGMLAECGAKHADEQAGNGGAVVKKRRLPTPAHPITPQTAMGVSTGTSTSGLVETVPAVAGNTICLPTRQRSLS